MRQFQLKLFCYFSSALLDSISTFFAFAHKKKWSSEVSRKIAASVTQFPSFLDKVTPIISSSYSQLRERKVGAEQSSKKLFEQPLV